MRAVLTCLVLALILLATIFEFSDSDSRSALNDADLGDQMDHEAFKKPQSVVFSPSSEGFTNGPFPTSKFSEIQKYLYSVEPNSRIKILALMENEELKRTIGNLSIEEVCQLLEGETLQPGTYLGLAAKKLIYNIHQDSIDKDDKWTVLLGDSNGSSIEDFIEYLAKRSNRFSPDRVADTLALVGVEGSQSIRLGILNRLNSEDYDDGQRAETAVAIEYLAALPDSELRDSIYADAYI